MQIHIFAKVIMTGCLLAVAACASNERESVSMRPPEATGTALWSHMHKAGYTRNWPMWPGKRALYQGQEPHGALLTTYVNHRALAAIDGKHGAMPEGAIVIKENYMPGRQLAAITVMYKVRNYNPEAGDWYWVKYKPDGAIEGEGKLPMCISCHSAREDNDYIYTDMIQ